MNKKIILLCTIFIILLVAGVTAYIINNKPMQENNNRNIAVVFFSHTRTTASVAEYIKEYTKAELFEIIPKNDYTEEDLRNDDSNSRAAQEYINTDSRPEMLNQINLSDYDVIFLGYPIWWGDVPRIIQTFIESSSLEGKTVIPFCTSISSGIAKSERTLKEYDNINWISGIRLENSREEVEAWLNTLNY